MSETQHHFYPTHFQGWSCGACGTWVSFGDAHECIAVASTVSAFDELNAQLRIAVALERIAAALEAGNERP